MGNRLLQLEEAVSEYAVAKTVFEIGRLQEDVYWSDRYKRLVKAECTLIALAEKEPAHELPTL